jgi:hypothetical protein
LEVGSEMSKGERMRTHTERTEGDHLSALNSSTKVEKEKDTLCVLNFSPKLKTPQKTRELEFGTHCVPNFVCHFNSLAYKVKYRKAKAWNHVI